MEYSNIEKRKIVKDDYNAIAENYAKCYSEINLYKSYIKDFLIKLNGKDILDVGCGAGQFTNYFCELGFNAIGIDFSNELLSIAKKNYPNIVFIYDDICEYKTNKRFDGIFVKDMFFHLPDEDIIKTLKLFKKILKPQGKMCIIMDIPKVAGEQIFVEELDDRYKIYYNYLTPQKLKILLEKTNITIDSIQCVEDNDNASSYATGLMVFQATNI